MLAFPRQQMIGDAKQAIDGNLQTDLFQRLADRASLDGFQKINLAADDAPAFRFREEIFAMSAKPGRLHQGAIRLLRLVVVIRRLPALLRLSSLSTRHPLCYRGQRRGVQLGQELLDVILHDDHFVVSRRHESFTDGVLCQRQQRAIVTCYV